jgi:hypothetical protein
MMENVTRCIRVQNNKTNRPWNGKPNNRDLMHLIGNNTTQELDSLKVLNNTFLVSKDTLGTGYNQVKGQNLYREVEEASYTKWIS